ncbi:c-type cytochrome [Polyangium jinanense]|uniref:C-type cytochrome n=2 Tax=Polyangium jinanense TaxID=2829994 RepID=A0A9X4AW39_9BACT|nr:c-type cytochrome [Polyangium jinanense]
MNRHFPWNPAALVAFLASLGLVGSSSCTSKDRSGENVGVAPSASATLAASVAPVASSGPPRCAARSPRRFERAAAGGASSAVTLVRAGDKTLALVADHDERALHVVDTGSMRQVSVTPLEGRPGHVVALEGGLVAVGLRDTSRVLLLEPADEALAKPFEERCAVDVAAEPWAFAEEGGSLLVTSGFGGTLTVLATADLAVSHVVPLPREPRAVIVANAGGTAFVTHAVGGVVSVVDLKDAAKAPESISLHAGRRVGADGTFDDKTPRAASQGYALARVIGMRSDGTRDALRIFAPHTSVDPGAPAVGMTIGYGGSGQGPRTMAQLVSVVDPGTKRSITNHVAGVFNAAFGQDCILPRSAAADENGLFVACLDIDAVIEMDPWVGDPSVAERRRIALPAGPSSLVLSDEGKRVFVWSEMDRALSRIERESFGVTSVPLWRRSGVTRDPKIERGRRLFHTTRDARLGMGRGCASCHPEGREDGLAWTSPDGLRQTPMLAGRIAGTGPYGWFGEHGAVRDHLNETFTRLGGTGLSPHSEEDHEALLAYVSSLPPPPQTKPKEPDLAERGKQVYVAYGCNGCHKDGGTDGKSHDVGSGQKGERRVDFDTPSLLGVRATAPYYHDGRYSTLDEMLSAKDQRMFPGTLSGADKKALLAYLETL